ncbi:hypothetical protein ANO11243_097170 [Dothideomycetidae sp. 11243]|nr:hypothetical protein ANO11243_097170 [fungal sp. No.11243]
MQLIWNDALYCDDNTKSVLEDAFDADSRLVPVGITRGHCHAAVVADNTTSDTCEIFTSYNKGGDDDAGCCYTWPKHGLEDLTCALAYFKTVRVFDQYYQDGAMKFNNPTPIAVREARVLGHDPGKSVFNVSIGCGVFDSNSRTPGRLHQRVGRFVDHHTNAGKAYLRDRLSRDASRDMQYRLDPVLHHGNIALDDVLMLDRLENLVKNNMETDVNFRREIKRTAKAMISSLFYITWQVDTKARADAGEPCWLVQIHSKLSPDELSQFVHRYEDAKIHVARRQIYIKNGLPACISLGSFTAKTLEVTLQLKKHDGELDLPGSPFCLGASSKGSFLPLKRWPTASPVETANGTNPKRKRERSGTTKPRREDSTVEWRRERVAAGFKCRRLTKRAGRRNVKRTVRFG